MTVNMVWAELGDDGKAIRILKNVKQAVMQGVRRWTLLTRKQAVEEIRRAIWERDKKRCTHCGGVVGWDIMQMHERIWRGRGGEVSVANGTTLCAACHHDDPVAGHGKRKVQFSVTSK